MKPLLLTTLLLGLSIASISQAELYRFKVNGQMVIKDHIPQEYSALGYQVLNSQGRVIEEVAPAPTAEELAEKARLAAVAKARKEKIVEQTKLDQTLLKLYSQPKDVTRVHLHRSEETESYIQLQGRRIEELDGKLQKAQSQAANFERRSQEIPADLKTEIKELRAAIQASNNNISERKEELLQLDETMQAQYQRMRILQVYDVGTLPEEVDQQLVENKLADRE